MFLVGLTGGIASGKSTVSRMFKDRNCEIIDADEVARQVVEPGQPAWELIVKTFGKDILLPSGEIDREKLGKIIFSDSGKRRVLNSCTHPAIHKVMFWKILKLFFQGHRYVILDIPLLFESGVIAPFVNKIIVVYCDPETQLRRLVGRNGYTAEHAHERICAQMALNEKCQWATHVVNNSKTEAETLEQVNKIYHELRISRAYVLPRIVVVAIASSLILLAYFFVNWIWQQF